jgi:thiosulfate/3-mercaptopyruvate sulfurtransferase
MRLLFMLTATVLFAQTPSETTVAPEDLAARFKTETKVRPLVVHVGFPVLYRSTHITDSQYAGPGSKAEGIEDLKRLVSGEPHDREIILYCGCCPWEKCPNVRPALQAIRDLGFKNVKALMIPTNLAKDWVEPGYPTFKRAAP